MSAAVLPCPRASWERIPSAFCLSRNEFHKRKATHVFHGFGNLVTGLVVPLQMIAAGTATEEAPDDDAPALSGRLLP